MKSGGMQFNKCILSLNWICTTRNGCTFPQITFTKCFFFNISKQALACHLAFVLSTRRELHPAMAFRAVLARWRHWKLLVASSRPSQSQQWEENRVLYDSRPTVKVQTSGMGKRYVKEIWNSKSPRALKRDGRREIPSLFFFWIYFISCCRSPPA